MTKVFGGLLILMIAAIIGVGVTSCRDDDSDNSILVGLYGTWSGQEITSATGSVRSLTVTFSSNGSGEFIYSSRSYYRVAEFSYKVKGAIITCNGIIVGEDGVFNNFNQQFNYHNTYITPIGAYSDFTLTK